jgi:hypothetical protein
VEETRRSLPTDLKIQLLDRSLVPTVLFTEKDLIVTLGQDGVVANTAKYVKGQPIIAVNPDPERFDGILMPFQLKDVRDAIALVVRGREPIREVTMAEARLEDGQRILAFNDLFIGASSHVSARYKITVQGKTEYQSSSGILVSTGAGSTGWMSSVFNMAGGLAAAMGGKPLQPIHMNWEDPRLIYVAREPFISLHSSANLVTGWIGNGEELLLESIMPSGGCVFSDGIEADAVEFNAGAILHVQRAKETARLVIA